MMGDVTDSLLKTSGISTNSIALNLELANLESIIRTEKAIKTLKMNYESQRLESFKYWPIPFISINDLVKNGFYYTGLGDLVCCNYCQITLAQWKVGDVIENDHKKYSPRCPWFIGNVYNVPMKRYPDIPIYTIPNANNPFSTGHLGRDVIDN